MGGGVAGLEAVLALRALAADRVSITLVSPAADFTYQPAGVLSAFAHRPARRLALAQFAQETGIKLEQRALEAVVPDERTIVADGHELRYDALLIALGAHVRHHLPGISTGDPAQLWATLAGVIDQLEAGELSSIVFIAPAPTWPLPAYELALLAAEHARGLGVEITVITAERQPLQAFGEQVSAAVRRLLEQAEIELVTGSEVEPSVGGLTLFPARHVVHFDRIVSLPRLGGPSVAGLPRDADGFLHTTGFGEVLGVERVYAAGDATSFPVKFGAIAAQQADAAASAIAALAGAEVEPAEFDGEVHGVLFSRASAPGVYFSARLGPNGESRESRVSSAPTWPIDAKIAALHLSPYLDKLWAEGPRWIAGQLAWEAALSQLQSANPR